MFIWQLFDFASFTRPVTLASSNHGMLTNNQNTVLTNSPNVKDSDVAWCSHIFVKLSTISDNTVHCRWPPHVHLWLCAQLMLLLPVAVLRTFYAQKHKDASVSLWIKNLRRILSLNYNTLVLYYMYKILV